MKNHAHTSSSVKQLLIAMATISFAFLTVSQAEAKSARNSEHHRAIAIVAMSDMAGINIKNREQVRTRLQQLTKNNPKMRRLLSKNVACVAFTLDERSGGWSCVKRCVGEVGVSPLQLIGCGVSCAAAGTGIGALACAVCVGVSVTVIQTCAIGCAIWGRDEISIEEDAAWNTLQQRAPVRSLQAKLKLNTNKATR